MVAPRHRGRPSGPLSLLIPLVLLTAAHAQMIGHGRIMYHPVCATACRSLFSGATLACTEDADAHGGHHGGGSGTSPACRASDPAFLTSVAYCVNATCAPDIAISDIEWLWENKLSPSTGESNVVPVWSYGEALQRTEQAVEAARGESLRVWDGDEVLNFTSGFVHEDWVAGVNGNGAFEEQETLHARYGIVILATGFAAPFVLTWLIKLPILSAIHDRLHPYLSRSVLPPWHITPLPYLLGNPPTIAQSLYVIFFFGLNLILSAVGYSTRMPNSWWETPWQELMAYIANRTGIIGYAVLPLVVLFAGRNNILLRMTNWSHGTFMILHRWVARVFALQAIVHSCVELALYVDLGSYEDELVQEYWIWGAVATVATCAMLVFSILWVRRRWYEAFLALHIVLAAFVIIGCWYHVELLFKKRWGYEYWLYAAMAVWVFDRVVRVVRVAQVGLKKAKVSEVGGRILRVDVEGVAWDGTGEHAYVSFPTLRWSGLLQNHPFSVLPSAMLRAGTARSPGSGADTLEDSEKEIGSKEPAVATARETTTSSTPRQGITIFIKKERGITAHLEASPALPVLLDGPYRDSSAHHAFLCERLVVIAGGIGITAVLPFARAHLNAKLYWSLKEEMRDLAGELKGAVAALDDSEVSVGRRFDLEGAVLEEEARRGWASVGIVVCGPAGMCDGVRTWVGQKGAATDGVVVRLAVEAFTW